MAHTNPPLFLRTISSRNPKPTAIFFRTFFLENLGGTKQLRFKRNKKLPHFGPLELFISPSIFGSHYYPISFKGLPSLKLTASLPLKIGHPKRIFHFPTIHFQGQTAVRFGESISPPYFEWLKTIVVPIFLGPSNLRQEMDLQDGDPCDDSGQIIIFHQPRFPWNKGIPLLNHHLGWGRVRSL